MIRCAKSRAWLGSFGSFRPKKSNIWAWKLLVGWPVGFQGLCHFAVACPFQLFVKTILGCSLKEQSCLWLVCVGGDYLQVTCCSFLGVAACLSLLASPRVEGGGTRALGPSSPPPSGSASGFCGRAERWGRTGVSASGLAGSL